MFNIAVCDDSSVDIVIIQDLLEEYQAVRPSLKMKSYSFNRGQELLEHVKAGNSFDLYLLDILMPGLDGIAFAKELRSLDNDVPVVFLTSTEDYALQAFHVYAIQYLVKPLSSEALFPVLDRIIFKKRQDQDGFLLFPMPDRLVKLPFSSIVCVESIYHRIVVYMVDGSKLSSKSIRTPFGTAIVPLLEDPRFLYAHKSYVLNMEKVREISDGSFIMNNDLLVHVPRYRLSEAKQKYYDYLNKNAEAPDIADDEVKPS